MKEFTNLQDAQAYYRENGNIGAYCKIGNIIFTQDFYDQSGKEMYYGNKQKQIAFCVETKNRYKSTEDAVFFEVPFSERLGFPYLQ